MPVSFVIGSITAVLLITIGLTAWRGAREKSFQATRLNSAFDRAQFHREHGGGENQNFYFGQIT